MPGVDALHRLISGLVAWVEGFAATPYGGAALFAIAFVESSVFPIPPDVLLIALCLAQPEHSFLYALLCSVGSVLGGMLGYAIGYWGGRPLLQRWFSARKVAVVKRYFDRYNAWATGIAGLTPIPYKIFTISGGAFSIDFRIFVLASVISRSLRFFAVGTLMFFFGEPVRQFIERYFELLSVGFVVMLVLGYVAVTRGFSRAGREAPKPFAEAAIESGEDG